MGNNIIEEYTILYFGTFFVNKSLTLSLNMMAFSQLQAPWAATLH